MEAAQKAGGVATKPSFSALRAPQAQNWPKEEVDDLTNVLQTVADMKETVTDLKSQVSQLTGKVDEQAKQLEELKAKNTTLTTHLNTLTDGVKIPVMEYKDLMRQFHTNDNAFEKQQAAKEKFEGKVQSLFNKDNCYYPSSCQNVSSLNVDTVSLILEIAEKIEGLTTIDPK